MKAVSTLFIFLFAITTLLSQNTYPIVELTNDKNLKSELGHDVQIVSTSDLKKLKSYTIKQFYLTLPGEAQNLELN